MANWPFSHWLAVEPVRVVISASEWPIAACDKKRDACVAFSGTSPGPRAAFEKLDPPPETAFATTTVASAAAAAIGRAAGALECEESWLISFVSDGGNAHGNAAPYGKWL